jgi:Spy/CpxP family protein refolding chaperone
MKLFLTVSALTIFLLIVSQVAADDNASQALDQIQQTIEQLDLSDEQIEQIKPVLQESMAAQQEIMSSYGIDIENREGPSGKLGPRKAMSMRKELDEVRADTLNELEDILSAEQLDEFKAIQDQRRAEMRDRIRGAR